MVPQELVERRHLLMELRVRARGVIGEDQRLPQVARMKQVNLYPFRSHAILHCRVVVSGSLSSRSTCCGVLVRFYPPASIPVAVLLSQSSSGVLCLSITISMCYIDFKASPCLSHGK